MQEELEQKSVAISIKAGTKDLPSGSGGYGHRFFPFQAEKSGTAEE